MRSAAAAQDHAAAASHGHELPQHVAEPQHDGTVIYHFGGDAEVAAAHAAAPAASAVAAAAHLQQAPQAVAVLPQSAPSQRQVASVQLPALLPRAPPGSSSKDESSGPGASGGGRRHHYLGQEQQQAAHANGSAAPRHAARHRGLASAVVAPKAAQQRDRGSRPPRRRKDGPSRNSPSADWDASLAAPNARSLGDYKQAQLAAILATYEAACERRDLDDALTLVKECVRAGRSDVLGRCALVWGHVRAMAAVLLETQDNRPGPIPVILQQRAVLCSGALWEPSVYPFRSILCAPLPVAG